MEGLSTPWCLPGKEWLYFLKSWDTLKELNGSVVDDAATKSGKFAVFTAVVLSSVLMLVTSEFSFRKLATDI